MGGRALLFDVPPFAGGNVLVHPMLQHEGMLDPEAFEEFFHGRRWQVGNAPKLGRARLVGEASVADDSIGVGHRRHRVGGEENRVEPSIRETQLCH